MEAPKSLDSLFKEKIFRIPDYQRGYAWQIAQLKDFWEDLVNLSEDRSHYTGVLTLAEVSERDIGKSDNEYWLVEDHSYKIYHIVDGQQRLTTSVMFLQAFIEYLKEIPENTGKAENEIYITGSLNLSSIASKYLYRTKPTGDRYRTYKFGYTADNPSYSFLRYRIFNESGAGSINETFYTLNLKNAKTYFHEQLDELYSKERLEGLQNIYKTLTKRLLFNEYIIKDEFDVFVAFETMNNRGKRLSDLELLKNRLIYLTTLYTEDELDAAERRSLREAINEAWKEVYYQLGRNDKKPLNDDEFLKAHWIMYFKYSRKRGNDYIKYLLDEQFTPQKVHEKVERNVNLEQPEEQRTDLELELGEDEDSPEESATVATAMLGPAQIKEYVNSLKESAVHWFNSYYPHLSTELGDEERAAMEKLNRVGMVYFRPLVMALFKNEKDAAKRTTLLHDIERYIFIAFRLCQARSNYRDSEYYNAARELDRGELTISGVIEKLKVSAEFAFNEDGTFKDKYFYDYLYKLFESGSKAGYYGWKGLRYFLYEYELSLLRESRQKKVRWEDLLKTPKDCISIEHILPQTATEYWQKEFSGIPEATYRYYNGTLGNLLLLSMSVNSSLQNDSFPQKKSPKFDETKKKIRNGHSDGSHSEIEVARNENWSATEIKERGMKLLSFMEKRWGIQFKDEAHKEKLLFLDFVENEDGKRSGTVLIEEAVLV